MFILDYILITDILAKIPITDGRVNNPYNPVLVGQSVEFTCSSSTPVQWIKMTGNMPEHSLLVKNTLTLSHLQLEDSGAYACIGSLEDGLNFTSKFDIYVAGMCYSLLRMSLSIVQ